MPDKWSNVSLKTSTSDLLTFVKVKLRALRQLIREEYLHGVPEWQLRQDTSEFVDQIRDRIMSYVLVNKSENGMDRQEAISAMNDTCDELEAKVFDVLENELWSFTRQV